MTDFNFTRVDGPPAEHILEDIRAVIRGAGDPLGPVAIEIEFQRIFRERSAGEIASLIGTMGNMVHALAELSARVLREVEGAEALGLPVTIDQAIEAAIRSLELPDSDGHPST